MSAHLKKKLLYGFLYLIIIFGVASGIYYLFFIPEPSCFDGVQNQDETDIDCGGSCIDCELLTLTLDKGKPQVFSTGETRASILVEITNPSANYGLRNFDYTLRPFSFLGTVLGEFSGKSYISPNETKYLIEAGVDIDARDIEKVVLEIPEENWEAAKILPTYSFATQNLNTVIVPGSVEVRGTVSNSSSKNYSAITVIAIIFNNEGEKVNISSTKLDKVAAFSNTPFTVLFPKLSNIYSVQLNATKVFYEAND